MLCLFVTYLFFSLVLSFFFSFFVGARVVFMIFFPHQAIFIPPPPGGGYFPIYRPLVERCAGVYGVGNILKTSVADPDPGLGAFLPLDPGSGIGFFRIQSDHWIRIRNLNTDPDPGGQK